MLKTHRIFLSAAIAAVLAAAPTAAREDPDGEPVVLGYIEDVHVGSLGLQIRGKLDTGADTSSVYARDIELYDKRGKDTWVRFQTRRQGWSCTIKV